MATIKHLTSKNSNYAAAESYLTFQHNEYTGLPILDEKGRPKLRDSYLLDTLECGESSFAMACLIANRKYGKNGRREDVKTHHYIISFDPKDAVENGLTMERAQALGLQFCKDNFPGHPAIVCTHPDGHNSAGNIHVHIVIEMCIRDRYKENLVDRSLLFITTDKHKNVHCLEVTFDIGNFLHMTGFKLRKSGINARHFFNLCYDKRLTEADFDFSADGTTEMKMRVLPSLMKKNLSAKMLGDYNMSQPKLYTDKIAGSLSACMGFVRDGGEGRFVPNTVLEGDIRTKVKAADRIIATYRKSRSEEQYSEIVFTAKKVEWEKIVLPDEYSYLVLPE